MLKKFWFINNNNCRFFNRNRSSLNMNRSSLNMNRSSFNLNLNRSSLNMNRSSFNLNLNRSSLNMNRSSTMNRSTMNMSRSKFNLTSSSFNMNRTSTMNRSTMNNLNIAGISSGFDGSNLNFWTFESNFILKLGEQFLNLNFWNNIIFLKGIEHRHVLSICNWRQALVLWDSVENNSELVFFKSTNSVFVNLVKDVTNYCLYVIVLELLKDVVVLQSYHVGAEWSFDLINQSFNKWCLNFISFRDSSPHVFELSICHSHVPSRIFFKVV